jgi:hypothetical protein
MKYELESHPGLIIENPQILLESTIDFPNLSKFSPAIVFVVEPNIRVYHQLPQFDYVDGTWEDEDVWDSISDYLEEIRIDG